MDLSLSNLQELVMHREAWRAAVHEGSRVGHDWVTEWNWIPDCLACLLRKLYVCQETIVRTLYGTTDWFRIEKGVRLGSLLSPYLFNLYTEHIMRNAELDELQARIKIGRRNIKNLRYVDDTSLMTEREEKVKALLMRVKEENEKASFKVNI